MGWKKVGGFIATTHEIPAYGGVRISEQALRQMFSQFEQGRARIQAQHDARLPLHPQNVQRELRRTTDGELGIWIEMDVDEMEWEHAGGDALRGFSVAISTPLTSIDPSDSRPRIDLAADAAHFDDEEIEAAAAIMRDHFAVSSNELLQFSLVPPPNVAVSFPSVLLQDVAAAVALVSALWAGLRLLLHPKQAERSIVTFDIEQEGRAIRARLETNSEDALKQAIDKLAELPGRNETTFDYDEASGQWKGYL